MKSRFVCSLIARFTSFRRPSLVMKNFFSLLQRTRSFNKIYDRNAWCPSQNNTIHLHCDGIIERAELRILRLCNVSVDGRVSNWTHITLKMVMKNSFWNISWKLKRAVHLNSPTSVVFMMRQSRNAIRRWRQLLDVCGERLHQQVSK